MNGEDERIKREQEEEEEEAAYKRQQVTREEKEKRLDAEYQERKKLEERNEAVIRRIREDMDTLNDGLNANVKRAVDSLANLSINKRRTIVVNNQRVFASPGQHSTTGQASTTQN